MAWITGSREDRRWSTGFTPLSGLKALPVDDPAVVPSSHDKRNWTARPSMPALKAETLTIRLCPEIKAALR
ncbi:MAG: hypothetical protein MZV65_43275 [Chromatiales bacterium]|nr:hypothetical protein [Chromatiales bacterium]